MKRPIKFRGRDAYGKLHYGDLWQRTDGMIIYDHDEHLWQRVHPDSVAQLVGYDCDGKEVYEDDTVTITRSTQTYKVGTEFTARRGAYVVDDIRSIMHFISEDFKLKKDTK